MYTCICTHTSIWLDMRFPHITIPLLKLTAHGKISKFKFLSFNNYVQKYITTLLWKQDSDCSTLLSNYIQRETTSN